MRVTTDKSLIKLGKVSVQTFVELSLIPAADTPPCQHLRTVVFCNRAFSMPLKKGH
jgi:hypothetical protein